MLDWQAIAIIYLGTCITIIVLVYIHHEYHEPKGVVTRLEPPPARINSQDLEWINQVTSDL